jgi:hypothetical protein
VSQVPDAIVLKRDRDLEQRSRHNWIRRSLFGLVCVVPILALLNVFGQRPGTTTGTASAVQLSISAPSRVRGGLLYQARFHITPTDKKLNRATLVLASGWLDGMTINTLEPSPVSETSINGKLALERARAALGPDLSRCACPGALIRSVPLSQLQRATGLSLRYVSLIRRGERTPHPRHWDAFRGLAELR